jgi:hypothetical protein
MNYADVEPERRADVAIDTITVAELMHRRKREHRRPPALTAREALVCLQFEAFFVAVAASNLANGVALTEADRERLLLAARRCDVIGSEVTG